MKVEERLVPVLLLKLLSELIKKIRGNNHFVTSALAKLHIYKRPVAQLAECRSPKPKVGGSMPSWPAI